MTLITPPIAMDGTTSDASLFRQALGSILGPATGLVAGGDLQVTQNGSPNMSVNVGTGRIWVTGTSIAPVSNAGGVSWKPQGPYFSENDATVNVPISASNPALPRLDQVICQVEDAAYAGPNKDIKFAVIAGTPTAGASLNNQVGLGAVPASSLVIAYVLVPANAASIVTADILNQAPQATVGLPLLQPSSPPGNSTVLPNSLTYAAGGFTQSLPYPVANGTICVIEALVSGVTGSNPVIVSIGSSPNAILGINLNASSLLLGTPGASVALIAFNGYWMFLAGEQDAGWVAPATSGGVSVADQTILGIAYGGLKYRVRGDRVDLRGVYQTPGSGTPILTFPAPGATRILTPAQLVPGSTPPAFLGISPTGSTHAGAWNGVPADGGIYSCDGLWYSLS